MTSHLIRPVLQEAAARLAEAGVATPAQDVRLLMQHVLGVDYTGFVLATQIDSSQLAEFDDLVRRRSAREPLQLITGRAPFRNLEIQVAPGVFIPRPETEIVVEAGLATLNLAPAWSGTGDMAPTIVDLCCGSGVMGLAAAQEVPTSRVIACDINPVAVALTSENSSNLGLDNHTVLHCDVADMPRLRPDLLGEVDLILTNPPYIPDWAEPLDAEVRLHDPADALYGGGGDGLDVPRIVVEAAARLLRTGAWMVMEHSDHQGQAVRDLVEAHGGFTEITTGQDLNGRDRHVQARRR